MYIKYKKTYEKIAMGLLSFMPGEKDIKKLQATMKAYETDESMQLLLWKEEEIIGVAGTAVKDDTVEVLHISVNPSFRAQGVGRRMVRALIENFPGKKIIPNEQVAGFFSKCCQEEGLDLQGEN